MIRPTKPIKLRIHELLMQLPNPTQEKIDEILTAEGYYPDVRSTTYSNKGNIHKVF